MNNKHGHGKHMLLMLLCCLIPIVLIIGLRFFNIGGGFSWIIFLLCPLVHVFMMKGMHGGHDETDHGSCHGQNNKDEKQSLIEKNDGNAKTNR